MRVLAAVLIALATLAWSAPAAEARTRSDQTQAQSRSAGQQANRASATRRTTTPPRGARASGRVGREAAATSRRGNGAARATPNRPTAGQSRASRQASTRGARNASARGTRDATSRGGARQTAGAACRGRNCAAQRRPVSWQAGLEPATNEQARSCPVGTMATLARGHSDIVRCMPL